MPEFKIFPSGYSKELPWRTFGLQWKKGEGVHVTRPRMIFNFPPTLLELKFTTRKDESVDG